MSDVGATGEKTPQDTAKMPTAAGSRQASKVRLTFRHRLSVRMTLLCTGILAASGLIVYLAVAQTLWLSLDRTLISIARAELASSLDGPEGRLHTHPEQPLPLELQGAPGYEKFVQIVDKTGHIVAQTPNLSNGDSLMTDSRSIAIAWKEENAWGNVRYKGRLFRGLYYHVRDRQGGTYLAIVALPREPVRNLLGMLAIILITALFVGAAATTFTADRMARQLTRPLERIVEATRTVEENDLSVRVPAVSPDAELEDLTRGCNAMISRLEAAFAGRQQALESQRRFVADASHELRSPLANMQGHLEVALRRPRSVEDYRHRLEIALAETRRMIGLVGDLLLLSRADAATLTLHKKVFGAAGLAAESVAAFYTRAERAGIDLCLDTREDVNVLADPDRLREVVDNLLDNALRYAPSGTMVSVVITEQEGQALLSVVDAGPGLSPEDQEKVFQRFYRVDPSRDRDSGGTGLGLSIAKAIMEAHGGSITVRSRPGVMTAFTISLPALQDSALKS